MTRLLFIGAGNMAEALARGLVRAQAPFLMRAADVVPSRLELFRDELGIQGTADAVAECAAAQVVVLAVKPQQADAVLESLRPAWGPDKLLVSICAGVRCPTLAAGLGPSARVVRVMPNTPALVGLGASAVCAAPGTPSADIALVKSLLTPSGLVVEVPEAQMDAVTAVSGSGPAYVFFLAEAMAAAAADLGMDSGVAAALIAQTIEGAGRMLAQTGLPPGELRRRVTSKGGTTAAALSVLEESGTAKQIRTAVLAAARRAQEMGR